jgi:hypothetical protein
MAAATGISLRSVQRIWTAHGLQPHWARPFKLSQDPAFAAKLREVVGLYLDPPAHSLVLSVAHAPPPAAGRVPLPRRPPSGDQSLPRRSQRQPETFHLDRRPDTIIAGASRGYQ